MYDEMHEKLTKDKNYTRFLTKRRSSTVEPVLGTLINHHNMKRINSRGMAQANKHVLMAALTYNLKKYLRFVVKKPSVLAQILSLKQREVHSFLKTHLHELKGLFFTLPEF
uniref:transposase n=1 Tax=Vaginella massiliensis TaxID=1816680 RepID=UPI0021CF88F9|nr:transposase [Vaginella massiliensis]